MSTFLSIVGIVASIYMVIYREPIGDTIGEADWMRAVGGVYIVVALIGFVIFYWSIAELTNTTDILFAPLIYLIPGLRQTPPPNTL